MISLYNRIFTPVERMAPHVLPLLARLVFAATLLGYYWASAKTKVIDRNGEGFFDFLTLEAGAFGQMFPKRAEEVLYDLTQATFVEKLVMYAGSYAEFVLPALIVLGLLTRLAALGMIGFVFVQTFVDVTGHGAELGSLFDARYGLIDERVMWGFLFAYLVFRGAGAISLDRLLFGPSVPPDPHALRA